MAEKTYRIQLLIEEEDKETGARSVRNSIGYPTTFREYDWAARFRGCLINRGFDGMDMKYITTGEITEEVKEK